jgi:hypothetical protein
MSFNGTTTREQVNRSMGAMLLLNSSCQGIVETYIQPSASPWFSQLRDELKVAQELVRDWRTSGYLYFSNDILAQTISCATAFDAARPDIEALFDEATGEFAIAKQSLIDAFTDLVNLVAATQESIRGYEGKIQAWGDNLQKSHTQMATTIASIQNQEAELQAIITATNEKIASLQAEIVKDRQAIADAEEDENQGIVETIFGVLLSPFTGGASLILAGIGVSSIVGAEAKISGMQSTISTYQQQIVQGQGRISDDQKQLATLQGLTLSTSVALADMGNISQALQDLQISWQGLMDELQATVSKLGKAATSTGLLMEKAWFDAACAEIAIVAPRAKDLSARNVVTKEVRI